MSESQAILERWCEQVRQCARQAQKLGLRGGASKDFWGPVTQPVTPLSTRSYSGIISHEPSELVLTARAGTPLRDIEAQLAQHGQHLAFEPPHFGPQATLGGAIAAGLSGPARASAGAVRDYILGVQCINGRGELLQFGGQVMKNVAGYDVSRLMAGSWGTLGLITEVSLKVLPIAPGQASLRARGLKPNQALDLLKRWGTQPLPLHASCWLPEPHSQLFVRLSGARAAVDAAQDILSRDIKEVGGHSQTLDPDTAAAHWEACREQTLDFFDPPDDRSCLWRLSLPPSTAALDLTEAMLIEWHGGQRWLWAGPELAPRLIEVAGKAGGYAHVFRSQCETARGLGSQPAATVIRISRDLQKQFDPHGVFDTGRLGF